ncbi:flavodoxin family protein [Furfurilactobacillus milii]|uniref:Flavoprotein n=1 Tax=Furfurilactobacillus milii TaxID=2888272 RepID=A0A6N9I3G6_9LACO|nr:flavodoxin family protein [Furfurilactobacillus milii]MYV17505.1 flavoprotein [Furfurilactobacillus milii]
MTIAVRYQTRNGNTEAFANQIAAAVDAPAEKIDTPLPTDPVDVLFVGGGTYMMRPDKTLSAFMATLDAAKVKHIAFFTTSGGPETPTDKALTKLADEKGIPVIGHFHQMMGGKGMFGSKSVTLKPDQIQAVKTFAESMLTHN